MSSNVRVRKSSAKTARLAATGKASQPRTLKEKTAELQTRILRVEMDIVSASRQAKEHRLKYRDTLPPAETARSQSKAFAQSRRLTLSQTRARNRKLMIQVAEFAVTAIILVGACAWLYQWWSRTHTGI
jgi:hypothetical protein